MRLPVRLWLWRLIKCAKNILFEPSFESFGMKSLRWKPLKSSVQQARSLTAILEGINLFISGFFILAAVLGIFAGQLIAALICIPLGVVTYLIFKMAYIALELLTEIADDTRLQLMALAGDEYDQIQVSQDNASVESGLSKDDLDTAEIYNAAVKGYGRIGSRRCSFSESLVISREKVSLRDSNGDIVMTMVLYDGEWIRE